MKKATILFCLLFIVINSFGQRDKSSQLEDSIFTWKAIPKLNDSSYPRTFSQTQLKYPELFSKWLQKSYIPIGALDFSYAIAEPNKKEEVQPYGTGINAAMWRAMWDKAGTKVIRQPHSENGIFIITNNIIDAEPVPMLTITGRAVFTRRSPEIERAFKGSSERRNQLVRQLKLEDHPQIGKYIIQYYGCDGEGCQPLVAVYITPNGKMPIRQLNRGEVLDMCEQAITVEAEKRREKIRAENRTYGKEAQQKWVKKFDEETLPHWKANIQKLRDKYRQSLNIPAELKNSNGIWMSNFETYNDIFDIEDAKKFKNNTYGIYTYEDDVLQKSKQDQPLWVCISWQPTNIQNASYAREIHRSMITHFNFEYVYDYFFRPESVKNKPYTTLNAEVQKSHLASFKNKKESKPTATKNLTANVYFFEDFASNSTGEKPQGWYVPSVGVPSVVTTPSGESGKWVKLEQHWLMPNYDNKPLPDNFKMEFDAATDKDFTENTGGAFLLRIHNKIMTPNGDYKDAPKQIFIDLDIKAGNEKFTQNPTGYTRLKATYTGMNSTLRYADVLKYNNDFSNKKSKVHFTIIKEGNKVRAFIDGKEIGALDKYGKPIPGFNELPEGAKFTSFYFENITNHSSKRLGVYITNIKVTKL
ncbi:MAG: hypothetical protein J0I32_04190 [Sphingobacteriales bacterium]|nr:hypothetical protein [Sphingobacteriales bacterium]OJW05199.1 MAG: hypothetical protein BGO52_22255 [Sphingobacteriales bacterium 44-61]